jgi:hypothetical protein
MGQVLHSCATTTLAVRAAIKRSKAPVAEIAERQGLNSKTVRKWRGRAFIHDAAMGPKAPRSSVLIAEEEAMMLAFRLHTLLPRRRRILPQRPAGFGGRTGSCEWSGATLKRSRSSSERPPGAVRASFDGIVRSRRFA